MVHTSAVPPPKTSLRGRARNKLRLMGRFWQLYLLLAPAWLVVFLTSRLRKRPEKEQKS